MPLDYSKTATVLFEFKTEDGKVPDTAAFKRDFGLGDHEVDDAYGFIPMQDSFVTVVAQDAAERVAAEKHPRLVGFFSNGHIAPVRDGGAPAARKPGGFGGFGPA
jgi:hypothetical protein